MDNCGFDTTSICPDADSSLKYIHFPPKSRYEYSGYNFLFAFDGIIVIFVRFMGNLSLLN